MIENSWKITFERVLRHAADEQEDISTGIVRFVWTNIKDLSEGETARYDDTIREYLTGRINPLGNFLEIRAGCEVLYSNLEFREPIIVNFTIFIFGKTDRSGDNSDFCGYISDNRTFYKRTPCSQGFRQTNGGGKL